MLYYYPKKSLKGPACGRKKQDEGLCVIPVIPTGMGVFIVCVCVAGSEQNSPKVSSGHQTD